VIKVPNKVNGVELSEVQCTAYRRMVRCLVEQAGFAEPVAVKLAEPAFVKSHDVVKGAWRAKKDVQLEGGHGMIRSCRFWREENAARSRA